jgi:Zn-dependent protease with chaperone function
MNRVAASYFDGKTSRRHDVYLTVQNGIASIGESFPADVFADTGNALQRSCPLAQLHVSERISAAARKVTFPDGAYLEINDHAAFNGLLADTGHRDSWIVALQQSWRGSLLAPLATAAILILSYLYSLPAAARVIAFNLPVSMERSLGDGILDYLDQQIFKPSTLPATRQQALRSRFQSLLSPTPDRPAYVLLFRQSTIGPNAFALPSGDIILTDELVHLLADDEAVMGVLAHELGHLHERHLTRRLLQSSAIAAAATLLVGDVSAVIATIPTLMLDLKYARDAETEADEYALRMLDKNGIAREHLAVAFEKLGQLSPEVSSFLSSHPSGAERVRHLRGQTDPGIRPDSKK